MRLRPNQLRNPVARQALAAILALCYLLASQGWIPSPAWIIQTVCWATATADRYPCEGCGCGCASARECWTDCCCHSPEERLAWAIANGVEPPAYARFTEAQWVAALDLAEPGPPHCQLCIAEAQSKLAQGQPIARPDPNAHSVCSDCRSTPTPTAPSCSALKCKAIEQLLAFAPVVAGKGTLATLLPAPKFIGMLGLPTSDRPDSRTLDVASPPPRLA